MPKYLCSHSADDEQKKKAKVDTEKDRQKECRKPRKCIECSERAARIGYRFCQRCYTELRHPKEKLLGLY